MVLAARVCCWCVNITEWADTWDTISTQPGLADLPNLKCAVLCGQHIAWYTFFFFFFNIFRALISSKECIFPSERVPDCDAQELLGCCQPFLACCGIRCCSWPDSPQDINRSLLMKVKAFIFISLKFHSFPGLLWGSYEFWRCWYDNTILTVGCFCFLMFFSRDLEFRP